VSEEESETPDPVELAERTVDATNAGDLDALLDLYSPEAVWDSADPDLPGERFEGRAAIQSFFEEWFGTIEDVQVEAVEIRDVGCGVVFAYLVQRARPRGSAASIEFRFATVTVWIDGLIHQVWVYLSVDAARRAAVQLAEERS
jgi:ketosteroid isomerase-like protein